jgi:hypothetical protein
MPDDVFSKLVRQAVDANAKHMGAYFRNCGITGAPIGTPSPILPPATGTELPFGVAPIGAPIMRGVSAQFKQRQLAAQKAGSLSPTDVPELLLDKANDCLYFVRHVAGTGIDALMRAVGRLQTTDSIDTLRFVDGKAVSAELSSAEDLTARRLLQTVVARMPAAQRKITGSTAIGTVFQALANVLQQDIKLYMVSRADAASLQFDRRFYAQKPASVSANSSAQSDQTVVSSLLV